MKWLIDCIFFIQIITLSFSGVKSRTTRAYADPNPAPQGTEPIYLYGYFSGVTINRDTEERKFVFNKDTNMYDLYVELNEGDYFYPFDSLKRRPFYWSKEAVPSGESIFDANGLSWYSYGESDGFWYVKLSGTFHFSITYLIENTINDWRTVWNPEYSSYIKYVCQNDFNQYCLFESSDEQHFMAYTEKDTKKEE